MNDYFFFYLRITAIFLLCGGTLPAQEAAQPPLPAITLHLNGVAVHAEVARTENQREMGLMFRKNLGDNEGMLFLMPHIAPASFWMKNTLIPLSIAYVDSRGKILEVHNMQAQDLSTVSSDSKVVAYALEMNLHWFELNHVRVGDVLDATPLKWSDLTALP